ncbi:MAG: DUF1499 domain-containing protein [Pseudomonadota bacterium]
MLGWITAVIVVPVVAVVAFFAVGPQTVWRTLAGDPDTGRLALADIARTGKPNDALLAPETATPIPPDRVAPVFAVAAPVLFQTVIDRVEAQSSVTWAEKDPEGLYARAVTFSPTLRFPDVNHIWVVADGDASASIAFYAAAQLGHSDLGKNRQRLETWLGLLDDVPKRAQ